MPDQQITITAILRDQVSPAAKKVDDAIVGIGTRVKELDKFVGPLTRTIAGLAAGFGALALARGGLRAITEFESGLVAVGKTTNIEGAKLTALGDDVLELATGKLPVATTELLSIAEAAGQLGVQGSANILRFTETIARLGASSDLAGAQAATTLARIIGLSSTQLEQVGNVGNVITLLGNNVEATESEIAAVAIRVAQSTSQFRLGAEQILAYGAAFRSLGVRSELAGNQLGRLFAVIDAAVRDGGALLDRVSSIAGATAQEFADAFRADPALAVNRFVEGLKAVNDTGGSVRDILDEIGLSGAEAAGAIIPLAIGVENLREAFGLAGEGIKNQEAILTESGKAFDTLESKTQRFRNTLDALFVKAAKPGEAEGILGSIKALVDGAASAIANLAGLSTGFDQLNPKAQSFARLVSALVFGFRAWIQVRIVTFLGELLFKIGQVIQAATSLNQVMALNPAGALAATIGLLAAGIGFFASGVDAATDSTERLASATERLAAARERIAGAGDARTIAARTATLDDDIRAVEEEIAALETAQRDFLASIREAKDTAASVARSDFLIKLGIDPGAKGSLQRELQDIFAGVEIDPRAIGLVGLERLRQVAPELARQVSREELRDVSIITNEDAIDRLQERIAKLRDEITKLTEAQKSQAAQSQADIAAERERFAPFLEALQRQRELLEASTDAERTRLKVLQDAERFSEEAGFSRTATAGQLSQHERFIELVKAELFFTQQAVEAAKKKADEDSKKEAATESLDRFRVGLEREIEATRRLTDEQTADEAARQRITKTIELETLAKAAGIAITDAEIAKLREFIVELERAQRRRDEAATRRTGEETINRTFRNLTDQARAIEVTTTLLRDQKNASLDLSEARSLATEVVQLERAAEAAGVEDVERLTQAYIEQSRAIRQRNEDLEDQGAFRILSEDVGSFFDGFSAGFTRTAGQLASLGNLGVDVGRAFVNAIGGVSDALLRTDTNWRQFAANFLRQIGAMILQAVILRAIIAGIAGVFGSGGDDVIEVPGGGGTGSGGFDGITAAEGGEVPGPPVRRDIVRALLMPREWVIPVDAALYYGQHLMEAIRRRVLPRDALQAALAGQPTPAAVHTITSSFASGGSVTRIGADRSSDAGDGRMLTTYIPPDRQAAERWIRGGAGQVLLRFLEERGFRRESVSRKR